MPRKALLATGTLFALVLGCSIAMACYAQHSSMMRGPHFRKPIQSRFAEHETSSTRLVWIGLIDFFRHVISPADGPRSPSYPTGSAYGKQAVETYGFFLGVVLTADRLIHEADRPFGPVITVYGKARYYDPLKNNTYWWDASKR